MWLDYLRLTLCFDRCIKHFFGTKMLDQTTVPSFGFSIKRINFKLKKERTQILVINKD